MFHVVFLFLLFLFHRYPYQNTVRDNEKLEKVAQRQKTSPWLLYLLMLLVEEIQVVTMVLMMGITTVVKMGSKLITLQACLYHCQLLFIMQLQKTLATTVQLRNLLPVRRMNLKFSGKPQNQRTKVLKNYLINSKSFLFEMQFSLIRVQLQITDWKPFFQNSEELFYHFPSALLFYFLRANQVLV